MAQFLVYREFHGVFPPSPALVRLPIGKVLDDAQYDVKALQAAGVRMVPFTNGAEAVLIEAGRGVDPNAGATALLGNAGAISQDFHVDVSTVVGPNDQDGTGLRPFNTIGKAGKAVPIGLPDDRAVGNIIIASGQYPEGGRLELDVTMRRINMLSHGPYDVGTPDQDTDIVIVGDYTQVGQDVSAFTIEYFGQGNPAKAGTFGQSIVPRIRGKLDFQATGTAGLLRGTFNVNITPTASDVAFTSVSGAQLGVTFNRCGIGGRVVGDGIDIQDAWDVRFEDDVTIEKIRRAKFCRIDGNWVVAEGPTTSRLPGFFDCRWGQGLDWNGPVESLYLDVVTNYWCKQPTALTLSGGATAVLQYDPVVIT